jgi:hypothetical protein
MQAAGELDHKKSGGGEGVTAGRHNRGARANAPRREIRRAPTIM